MYFVFFGTIVLQFFFVHCWCFLNQPWYWHFLCKTQHCGKVSLVMATTTLQHLSLDLNLIMSNERPSKNNCTAQFLKGKLSSLFQSSCPPTPSSINVDSSSSATTKAGTRWIAESSFIDCQFLILPCSNSNMPFNYLPSTSPVNINCTPDIMTTMTDGPRKLGSESKATSFIRSGYWSSAHYIMINYCPFSTCHFRIPLIMYTCITQQLSWPIM